MAGGLVKAAQVVGHQHRLIHQLIQPRAIHAVQLRFAAAQRHADDPLTAEEIERMSASKAKQTREERIAHAKENKPDRSEFKSKAARKKERKEQEGKSLTNKEKARKKNVLMTLGKARAKSKRSLIETRKALKAHRERQKRGGRRGNW